MIEHLAKWEKRFLTIAFVMALGVRLYYLSEIRSNPFFEHPRLDALFHDLWAQSIASGNVLGDTVFFRAPLYPYMLGIVYKVFGHSFLVPRILQHLLGSLSVVLVYLLARSLFNRPTAVIASIVMALYGVVIYFEGELLFESFLLFLVLAWSRVVLTAMTSAKAGWWFAAGLLLGLVSATRPPFLAVGILSLGFLVFTQMNRLLSQRRSILTTIALFLLGVIAPLAPIAARNYYVGGDIVLISSQGGVNFYIGNNPFADGFSSSMPGPLGASWENRDQSSYVEAALGHKPMPSEESLFWYKKGFEFIRYRPIEFANLTLKKSYLFWNRYEIPNNQSFYSFSQYSALLRILPVGFWLVAPLGLVGMILAWTNPRARFFIVVTLFYFLVTIGFFVCDRYRVPILPFLCVFGAHLAVILWRVVRLHEWSRLLKLVPLIVLSFLFVNSDLYGIGKPDRGREYLSLGIVAMNRGDYEKAIRYFQESESYGMRLPNLHLNWGVAEWMRRNSSRAIEEFRMEISLFPGSYGAMANLSQLYLDERNIDSAMACGERAIRTKPYVQAAYISTALALKLSGNIPAADSILRVGFTECGEDFLYGEYLLAGIDVERGRLVDAEKRYRSILERVGKVTQPLYEPEFQYSAENKIGERQDVLATKVMYGLGHLFAERGRPDSALPYFERATRMTAEFSDAWADLGIALLQLGRYDEAVSKLERALAFKRDNYLYWYNYGTILGTLGRLQEARDAFVESLKLNAKFTPARRSLEAANRLLR